MILYGSQFDPGEDDVGTWRQTISRPNLLAPKTDYPVQYAYSVRTTLVRQFCFLTLPLNKVRFRLPDGDLGCS